jgi:Fe-S-cluster containining protein
MCGACCTAISIPGTKKFIRAQNTHPEDKHFILHHWHRISRATAAERLPGLVVGGYGKGRVFYECDQYDSETKLCGAGEKRPPICKGFPWYSWPTKPADTLAPFPRCSYWHDVPREQWPEGIDPLPDPLAT